MTNPQPVHLSPEMLVEELDFCFSNFDSIISKYRIEKIKTVGDAYICASGLAQQAALACFEPASMAEYERRRAEFRRRRDFVVPALERIGLTVPVVPDGAFYAWADCSRWAPDSWDFVFDVMRRAQVAITPGRDFGHHDAQRWVRFSYASAMPQLQEAVDRLRKLAP